MLANCIFDSFKSLYELFDFWMELIQEAAIFFPQVFSAPNEVFLGKMNNEITPW